MGWIDSYVPPCEVISPDSRPALIALRDAFVSARTDFAGFEQHDAQEFLGFYFDSLQREAADFIAQRDHCGGLSQVTFGPQLGPS